MSISRFMQINQTLQGGRSGGRWMLLPRKPLLSRNRFGYGPALIETCMKDWESSPRDASALAGRRMGMLLS